MAKIEWTDQAAIDAYLDYLSIARGRSARTIEFYGLAMRRLQEFMGEKSILLADGQELEAYCGLWLHKKGIVAQSRTPYISCVRGFYLWAIGRGAVVSNPATALQHPRAGKRLPRAMSMESAERLMWAPDLSTFIGIRDATMMSLMIGCGLRVSGLVGINEGDFEQLRIEGGNRMALIVEEKGGKQRRMPIPKEADALLRVYTQHEELVGVDRAVKGRYGHADKVLFINTCHPGIPAHEHIGEKRRISRLSVYNMISSYGKKLGLPEEEMHPHAMRHLFGTELLEDDVPTITAQGLLGHADPKSTDVYVHLAMRKKMAVMDKSAPLSKMKTPVSEFLKRMQR